jgi:hypothetical protein
MMPNPKLRLEVIIRRNARVLLLWMDNTVLQKAPSGMIRLCKAIISQCTLPEGMNSPLLDPLRRQHDKHLLLFGCIHN